MVIGETWEALQQAVSLGVTNDGSDWEPPRVEIVSADEAGTPLRFTYLPLWVAQLFVMRDEAIDALAPLLAPYGLVRPVSADGATLAIFRAHPLSGVLDVDRSEIFRFEDGRVMDAWRPVFHAGMLPRGGAFRAAEDPRGPIYFTGGLVERISATGFAERGQFKRVWERG